MVDIGQATFRQSSRCIEIADQRSLAAQDYREVIRAIVPRVQGTNPLCSPTMPRLNVRARSSPSNPRLAACCARRTFQRNYHKTLSKQESIRHAPRPYSRIEGGYADCKSSRDRRDRGKGERGVTRQSATRVRRWSSPRSRLRF